MEFNDDNYLFIYRMIKEKVFYETIIYFEKK